MKEYKAVLLDFDSTLGNRPVYSYNMIKQVVKENFPELQEGTIPFEAVMQDCIQWDEFGMMSKFHMQAQIEKKYGKKLPYEHFPKYWGANHAKYAQLFPETIEVLEYLSKKYKLALLTNGMLETQSTKLDVTGIRKYFDICLVGDDTNVRKKPYRDIFDLAIEKLGVTADEAIMVGDTFSSDILGAYNAGIDAIWICSDPLHHCEADVTRIQFLREVMDIL